MLLSVILALAMSFAGPKPPAPPADAAPPPETVLAFRLPHYPGMPRLPSVPRVPGAPRLP